MHIQTAAEIIAAVDEVAIERHGEQRVGKIKTDSCRAIFVDCAREIKRNRMLIDQIELLQEAHEAVMKFTTLLEHSWGAAERLLEVCREVKHVPLPSEDEDDQVNPVIAAALDELITEVLGPPEERRAPHSRCAPHVKMQRPRMPERTKLTQVLQQGAKKIQMVAALGVKNAREEEWRNEKDANVANVE